MYILHCLKRGIAFVSSCFVVIFGGDLFDVYSVYVVRVFSAPRRHHLFAFSRSVTNSESKRTSRSVTLAVKGPRTSIETELIEFADVHHRERRDRDRPGRAGQLA